MLIGLKEACGLAAGTGTAVGSFNTPNLECLLAVLEAAETLDVPVIIAHAQCHEEVAPLDRIGPVMVTLAARSKAKVCVHLDHGEDFAYCKRAIDMGFTSAMIDYSARPFEENVAGTAEVVRYAHAHGAHVEAELGAMPQREGGGTAAVRPEELYTKVERIPEFIARTGADALAIAFGTAHGIYKTKPVLNLDIVSAAAALTDVPLVMHGGSGIGHDAYRAVIRRGIRKINYYSYMAYAGYAAARQMTEQTPEDFFHNLALCAQRAMCDDVAATLRVFSGR